MLITKFDSPRIRTEDMTFEIFWQTTTNVGEQAYAPRNSKSLNVQAVQEFYVLRMCYIIKTSKT